GRDRPQAQPGHAPFGHRPLRRCDDLVPGQSGPHAPRPAFLVHGSIVRRTLSCTLYIMMNFSDREQYAGVAAGVPYLLLPPALGRGGAPIVIGWHLLDPPRTEAAFAAALPLDGLDAWRLYLGL